MSHFCKLCNKTCESLCGTQRCCNICVLQRTSRQGLKSPASCHVSAFVSFLRSLFFFVCEEKKRSDTQGEASRTSKMTYLHFLNCAALTFGPSFVFYQATKLYVVLSNHSPPFLSWLISMFYFKSRIQCLPIVRLRSIRVCSYTSSEGT
jgi:hypothetical protein